MATITFPSASGPVAVATQAVYTRAKWGNPWTLQPDLWCQRLTRCTGETLAAAEFRHRFGGHLPPGASSWTATPVAAVQPLTYVAVSVSGAGGRAGFTWYGMWMAATKTDVDQTFSAVGMEYALDEPCLDAPWWDGTQVRWAGVGLEANSAKRANRSADKHIVNGQSVYVFDPQPITAKQWCTRDLVETLLAVAAPKSVDGAVLWNWTPINLAQLPDYDVPTVATHNVSYLNLLRSLVSRFHLTGFTVEAPASGPHVNVRFFSFAESPVELKDSEGNTLATIPACANKDAIVYAGDQSSSGSFSVVASNVADQVVVTGAPRQTVCTLWRRDNAWTGLWSEEARNDYVTGASAAADYPPSEEVDLRAQRNADARADETLRPVYSYFGPADGWTQLVSRGDVTYTATTTTSDGGPRTTYPVGWDDSLGQVTVYPPLLTLADRLPLKSGYAHDGDKIGKGDGLYRAEQLIDGPWEVLPPLVFVRVLKAEQDVAGEDRWQAIDQLSRTADLEQLAEGLTRDWSGDVRTLRDKVGLEIRVQGRPQHVLDIEEQDALLIATDTDKIPGSLDWGRTDQEIVATVAFVDPRPVEVRYPADDDVTAYGELVRRLRIADPIYQAVYVIPDTVVGLDPELLSLLRTDGGWLIDDRDRMRVLAQRLYQWHRVPRYALTLSTAWVDGAVKIGHLITQATDAAGTFPVLSVISEITLTFQIVSGGTPPRPMMTIVTAFGELGR